MFQERDAVGKDAVRNAIRTVTQCYRSLTTDAEGAYVECHLMCYQYTQMSFGLSRNIGLFDRRFNSEVRKLGIKIDIYE